MIADHVLSSDGLIARYLAFDEFELSNCSTVRGVDCEHHVDGEVISSRVNEGTGTVDVYETASHGVMKTKKRLLFFSSECLEKL